MRHDCPTSVKLSQEIIDDIKWVAEQLGLKRGVLIRELIVLGLSDYMARLHGGTTCRHYRLHGGTTCGDYQKPGTDLALNSSSSPLMHKEKDQEEEKSIAPSKHARDPLLTIWEKNEPFSLLADPTAKRTLWSKTYPKVDLKAESLAIIAWWDANPQKRKTKRGVPRFINSWMKRTQENDGKPQTPRQSGRPMSFDAIRKAEQREQEERRDAEFRALSKAGGRRKLPDAPESR
jgi:hypothetical protein